KSAADHSIVVSGHDQRAETKTPPAFHHFRAAIDENDFLGRIAFRRGSSVRVARIGSSACAWLRHELKFQTAFAGRFRQNFSLSADEHADAQLYGSSPYLLNRLAHFATNLFARVANAFTFVRFRWIETSDIRRHLADQLLVDPLDR